MYVNVKVAELPTISVDDDTLTEAKVAAVAVTIVFTLVESESITEPSVVVVDIAIEAVVLSVGGFVTSLKVTVKGNPYPAETEPPEKKLYIVTVFVVASEVQYGVIVGAAASRCHWLFHQLPEAKA